MVNDRLSDIRHLNEKLELDKWQSADLWPTGVPGYTIRNKYDDKVNGQNTEVSR